MRVWPATQEGQVVRHADRIAYVNHDIEDAITAKVLSPRQLPKVVVETLGATKSQRITTLISDLAAQSGETLRFSPQVEAAYLTLHDFMYSTVYVDEVAKKEERKVEKMISELYERLVAQPELMPNDYLEIAYQEGPDRAATDYISGMTDEFATRMFEELFVPKK